MTLVALGFALAFYGTLALLVWTVSHNCVLRLKLARTKAECARECARADRAEDRYAARRFSLAPSVSTGQGWREDVLLRDWWQG